MSLEDRIKKLEDRIRTEHDFYSKINSEKTIVGFFSPKCDCCMSLLPIYEEQKKIFPTLQFLKVRPSEMPAVFSKYSLRINGMAELPQFAVFRNGEKVASAKDIYNESSLRNFIQNN